jgi:hypothetical protein
MACLGRFGSSLEPMRIRFNANQVEYTAPGNEELCFGSALVSMLKRILILQFCLNANADLQFTLMRLRIRLWIRACCHTGNIISVLRIRIRIRIH